MATSTAFSMPRFRAIGLAPAATVFTPSRKMAWARTVAVVVPSPATSLVLLATSRTICAPMFSSGSRNSISLATVTPSLVMIGAPNFFSITALRPLGPRVIFTASARMLTPRRIAWREFSPVTICFAMSLSPLSLSDLGFRCYYRQPPGRIAVRGARPLVFESSLTTLALDHSPLNRGRRNFLFAARRLRRAADLREDFIFLQDHVLLVVNRDVVAAIFP